MIRHASIASRPSLALIAFVGPLLFSLSACEKKGKWLHGSWLLVEEGKPSVCHEFHDGKKLTVHLEQSCTSGADPLLSGKWQLKGESKLAIQRTGEDLARIALIGKRAETHFNVSGALIGTMYRVGKEGVNPLLEHLEQKGVLRMRALPGGLGCDQLGKAVASIRKLKEDEHPRLIRSSDQGLDYHFEAHPDARVDKVVFAVNQDQLDWVSFHLTAQAFGQTSPAKWLASSLGPPTAEVRTGSADKTQVISMWSSYCKKLRGGANRSVDLTLFATPAKKDAYFYVSQGLIAGVWPELKQAAADDAAQRAAGTTAEPDDSE